MPMFGLMEVSAVRIEAHHVDEGIHMVVQECVPEGKHCVNRIGWGSELARGKPPILRKELSEGAVVCSGTGAFVSEQRF